MMKNQSLADILTSTTSLARPPTNYFAVSARLLTKDPASIPYPLRTFQVGTTAINLSYDPAIRRISVDEAAQRFALPDLRPALADYLARENVHRQRVHTIGGQRHADHTSVLPFNDLQIWVKVRLQNQPFHGMGDLHAAQTLFSSPPDKAWTLGRYDAAIVNVDAGSVWPRDGLKGEANYLSQGSNLRLTI